MVVGSRLNIFHSKFYWRVFYNTDSWIFCLNFTQILTNNNNYYEQLQYVRIPWGHVQIPWGHVQIPWGHVRIPWGHVRIPWGHVRLNGGFN